MSLDLQRRALAVLRCLRLGEDGPVAPEGLRLEGDTPDGLRRGFAAPEGRRWAEESEEGILEGFVLMAGSIARFRLGCNYGAEKFIWMGKTTSA